MDNAFKEGSEFLSFDILLDQLESRKENARFDQSSLIVDFPWTQSLKSIILKDIVPKQFDTEVTSMWNI